MTMRAADNPSRLVVGGAPLSDNLPDEAHPPFPENGVQAARVGYLMACGDETVADVRRINDRGALAWRITYRNTNPRHA